MNTFAAKPQAVDRTCRRFFQRAETGKVLLWALFWTFAFGNGQCLGQSEPIPESDNLTQKIQQLENRVRQLEQNQPATDIGQGTTIEGAFLQVYHDERGKQQFFAVRVLWPNTDSRPRRIDPKDVALRVDEALLKAEKTNRRVGNMTIDHQGVRSDLNSLQPNRLITIQPHSVGGAWYVFDRIPLGSRIPKLTLLVPGLSGPEEIVINQRQAERLGMVIEQVGPRGCLGLVSISGHLTSINSQVLVDALSELAKRKVVRIVIQFLPDAAIPDASLRNWLLYSAAIASEEARNAGDSLPHVSSRVPRDSYHESSRSRQPDRSRCSCRRARLILVNRIAVAGHARGLPITHSCRNSARNSARTSCHASSRHSWRCRSTRHRPNPSFARADPNIISRHSISRCRRIRPFRRIGGQFKLWKRLQIGISPN